MYEKIGIPVDLSHEQQLDKALETAAALASATGASLHLVSVTSRSPGPVAHNPEEFAERLAAFAEKRSKQFDTVFTPHVVVCNDPSAELDESLDAWFHEHGVDLVVIASHVPGYREYVFSSNAGWLASHTDLSVLVVR